MCFFKAKVFTNVFGIISWTCNFGSQDYFVSVACFFEPCSNNAFSFPLGFRIGRNGIEFGYIKKINALI